MSTGPSGCVDLRRVIKECLAVDLDEVSIGRVLMRGNNPPARAFAMQRSEQRWVC
jgi:hypothetical protein